MRQYNKKGFTIIELMLAMGFVSALLLAIAMTVIQIGNIYNRGVTYKDVNQAGITLAIELQRSINSSAPFDLSGKYIIQDWGGRLCTGQYSYIWNYAKNIADSSLPKNGYVGSLTDVIGFVKVTDTTGDYCKNPYPSIIKKDAVELLNEGQNKLAIHSFSIRSEPSAYDEKTGQRLYSISFLLGTNEQTALTGSDSDIQCKLPNDANANPSYCAINQFNIVARAGNVANAE